MIQIDQMVTDWEKTVAENAKLPPAQRTPVPARSDDLVPLRWEAAALGVLQEAGEAYLIGKISTELTTFCFSNFRFVITCCKRI